MAMAVTMARALGVRAVPAKPFSEGGAGCVELAEVVRDLVARTEPGFKPLYEWTDTIEHKIATIARENALVHQLLGSTPALAASPSATGPRPSTVRALVRPTMVRLRTATVRSSG